MKPDDAERVHATTADEWRAWLADHHADRQGAWLVSWKKHTGKPAVGYAESVCEALCFGWVDSLGRKLDEDRTMLWFAPRRPTSGWSRPNKERVERLLAEGRMTPAGQRLIDLAKANGSWTLLDDVENLVVPPDLDEAFRARPGSREQWDGFPRSVRRGVLEWIVQAKRPATREKRVLETADAAERGERAHQWR